MDKVRSDIIRGGRRWCYSVEDSPCGLSNDRQLGRLVARSASSADLGLPYRPNGSVRWSNVSFRYHELGISPTSFTPRRRICRELLGILASTRARQRDLSSASATIPRFLQSRFTHAPTRTHAHAHAHAGTQTRIPRVLRETRPGWSLLVA